MFETNSFPRRAYSVNVGILWFYSYYIYELIVCNFKHLRPFPQTEVHLFMYVHVLYHVLLLVYSSC